LIPKVIIIYPAVIFYLGFYTELQDYFSLFSISSSPLLLSGIFTFFILSILFFTVSLIIDPLRRNHRKKETELRQKSLKIMALFAEKSNEPFLRLNENGVILATNPKADDLGFKDFINKEVAVLLPDLKIDYRSIVESDQSINVNLEYLQKEYSVQVNGIGYLKIAHLYFHDITKLKQNQRALEKSEKELKEFLKKLQLSIEEERQRIAKELHDDVGQNLLLLRLNLQRQFTELTKSKNSSYHTESTELIDKVIGDLKEISYSLKPMMLKERGLASAVFSLVNEVNKGTKMKGELGTVDMDRRFNANLEIAVYRVAQECVNNIIKYSEATKFNIELISKEDKIHLIVSDNGKGFDMTAPENKKGMGISNMRERTAALGGTFKLNSTPNEGTIIIAEFPQE